MEENEEDLKKKRYNERMSRARSAARKVRLPAVEAAVTDPEEVVLEDAPDLEKGPTQQPEIEYRNGKYYVVGTDDEVKVKRVYKFVWKW